MRSEWLHNTFFKLRKILYFYFTGVQANIILSKLPQSRNVSAGALVEFTCATEESGVTSFAIITIPSVPHHESISTDLPSGGRQHTLSFIVPFENSNITILCIAVRIPDVNQTTAILRIQGKIIDYC